LIQKLDVLPGNKTYLIVLVAIVLNVAQTLGYVEIADIQDTVNVILGFAAAGTIKLGLDR